MIRVQRYVKENKVIWNEFVRLAKNNHFFFLRDYMDYHSERFIDYSLMFFDEKNKLIALLPATLKDNIIYSHQGLTFGGLLIKSSAKQKDVIEIFNALVIYMKNEGFSSLVYKKIPAIYNNMPCDEDLYALFRCGAKLIRRDVSSSIKLDNQIKYSKGRKWIVKKCKQSSVEFEISNDISEFWDNLELSLSKAHGVKPVHSINEIKMLKDRFPDNIHFYSAVKDGKQLAGAVVFETNNVAHTQYLYNSTEGREYGALDGLVDYLVKDKYKAMEYFDFGISNENQGLYLNEGLIAQKEGFGARAIVHDFYEIVVND